MNPMITLILTTLFFSGCEFHTSECHYDSHGDYHCHESHSYEHHTHDGPTTTVVTTSANNGGGHNNNIIVIEEEQSWCSWDNPHYHDPEYCTFDDTTCCMWLGIGVEETYCYYDYCGWELVSVYSYY